VVIGSVVIGAVVIENRAIGSYGHDVILV